MHGFQCLPGVLVTATSHLHVHLLRGDATSVHAWLARQDIVHVVRMQDGTPIAVVVPGQGFSEVAGSLQPFLCRGGAQSQSTGRDLSRVAEDRGGCR